MGTGLTQSMPGLGGSSGSSSGDGSKSPKGSSSGGGSGGSTTGTLISASICKLQTKRNNSY